MTPRFNYLALLRGEHATCTSHSAMEHKWWDDVELERRFLLDRGQAERFLAATANHLTLAAHHHGAPAGGARVPVAYTRTTYLDTSDFSYLRGCNEHDAGLAAIARRLRIREYAAGGDPEAPAHLTGVSFLELKESMGAMRKKRRVAGPPGVLAEMVRRRGVTDPTSVPADGGALAAIQRRLRAAALAPCLVTWYRRWSFGARGLPIRVTLDEGLAYCRPSSLAAIGSTGASSLRGRPAAPAEVASYGPARVLEIKLQGQPPDWLAEAMADLPPAARFSKFQTGMDVLMQSREPVRTVATRPIAIPLGMAPLPA